MKHIKLMADYNCYPLWYHKSENIGNINPESLNLSKELLVLLNNWADEFNSFIDLNDPCSAVDIAESKIEMFCKNGNVIAKQLEIELGENYKVVYHGKNK